MTMTIQEAREWMLFHWGADDGGTDLDWDKLVESFHAVFGRYPDEHEDAFGILKAHFQPTLTAEDIAEIQSHQSES